MLIRNVSPFGDLEVPALGAIVVSGEAVDAPPALAESLLEQTDNWQPVQPKKEKS